MRNILLAVFCLFIVGACTDPKTGKQKINILLNVSPAGPDEALFIGDPELKVQQVLKRTLVESKGDKISVRDTSYYDAELRAQATVYELVAEGVVAQFFYVTEGKLRNVFAFLGKVPNSKLASFEKNVQSGVEFTPVSKGMFKVVKSPVNEYATFILVNNLKTDSTIIGIITTPNYNRSDVFLSRMADIVTASVSKNKDAKVKVSFLGE